MREDAEGVGLLLNSQKGGMGNPVKAQEPDRSELSVEQCWATPRRSRMSRNVSITSHHHWRTKIKEGPRFTSAS